MHLPPAASEGAISVVGRHRLLRTGWQACGHLFSCALAAIAGGTAAPSAQPRPAGNIRERHRGAISRPNLDVLLARIVSPAIGENNFLLRTIGVPLSDLRLPCARWGSDTERERQLMLDCGRHPHGSNVMAPRRDIGQTSASSDE
jgi:hypothetical protein